MNPLLNKYGNDSPLAKNRGKNCQEKNEPIQFFIIFP
jgi:hypothetical protein